MNLKLFALSIIFTVFVFGCVKEDMPRPKTKVEYRAKANYSSFFSYTDQDGSTQSGFNGRLDFTYSWYQDSRPVQGDSTLLMTMTSADVRSDTKVIAIYIDDILMTSFTTYGGGSNVNMKIAY